MNEQSVPLSKKETALMLLSRVIASPVGRLRLVSNERALVAILWEDGDLDRVRLSHPFTNGESSILLGAERELAQYFKGERQVFSVPLEFQGTEFQKAVWHALVMLPYGETKTYQELATRLGRPNAARAVGAANGKNPISIIAACHRLVGHDGSLTGYAGGLEAKALLIELEKRHS